MSGLAWWRVPCLARRVVVNLRSDGGVALRGWLAREAGAWLVLADVDALHPNAQPARVDGEVVIHRSNVSFIQVLHGDRE